MVTKSRLEELIKENAKVYIKKENKFNPYQLRNNDGTSHTYSTVEIWDSFEDECYLMGHYGGIGKYVCDLEDIYEEKATEWELENTAIVKDILKFPQWQDIKFDAHGRFVKRFHIKDDYDYFGELRVDDEHGTIIVQEVSAVRWQGKTFFDRGLTEENYKMACKICIKLFKGE